MGSAENTLPVEVDAHAAAALLARARYPEEVDRLLREEHEDAVVLRSVSGPEPVETLPARPICFAHRYATLCEQWARENRGIHFSELVESVCARAGSLWETLSAADL